MNKLVIILLLLNTAIFASQKDDVSKLTTQMQNLQVKEKITYSNGGIIPLLKFCKIIGIFKGKLIVVKEEK